MEKLTPHELDLINSKLGLKILLNRSKTELKKVLERIAYENKLIGLQKDMIKLQQWVIEKDKKVVVLFEGRDAAGKGGSIKRFTEHLNPRAMRVVALSKPTEVEKGQWYFRRYIKELPNPGEVVFLIEVGTIERLLNQ